MTTIRTLAAFGLFCLGPALGAGPAAPHQTRNLAFSPPPGTTLVYSLLSRLDSEGKGVLGEELKLAAQASGQLDLVIRRQSTDGIFADLSSPGIRVTAQVLDRENDFNLEAPADNPVRLVMDRSCRILSIGNAEALEERNPMNISVLDILRNSLPALPDLPVAPGDTWQDHKRLQIPYQGMRLLIEIESTYQLRDLTPGPEGELALVAAAYSVRLSGAREMASLRGGFEGKGAGTGSLSFLIGKGYFSDYRFDYSIDGEMVVTRGETRLAAWPLTLTQSAALTLKERR